MPRTIFENIVIQRFNEVTFFEFCQYTSIRFFEILYFKDGSGTIKINGNDIIYEPNSFFVFIPNDIYILQVDEPTTVTTIKFLKGFLNSTSNTNSIEQANDWFRKIEVSLNNENRTGKFRFQSELDKKSLISLIEILNNEKLEEDFSDSIVFYNTLSTILHILARNSCDIAILSSLEKQNSIIQEIVNFIHLNIYEPNLLKNKALANTFNLANNYIGQYFKKQMGISLKKYILNYKLKLVETRLKYTDLQISEIALELGFTDASHLNKIFKTYKGQSIATYRKAL